MAMKLRYMFVGAICCLMLLGCGTPDPKVVEGNSATPTPTASATPSPATSTPTSAPTSPAGQDTCSQSIDGTHTTIVEPKLRFSITYPSSLIETHCMLTAYAGGTWNLRVGNFLDINTEPVAGRTVAQYVAAHKMSYETVTLTTVAAKQAVEAYIVDDEVAAGAPGPPKFASGEVLLRGSANLYTITTPQAILYPITTDAFPPSALTTYVSGIAVS
jgi:hypothetical protein